MNICIDALGAIVATRINDEAVVGVNVSACELVPETLLYDVRRTWLYRTRGNRIPGPMLDCDGNSFHIRESGGSEGEEAG